MLLLRKTSLILKRTSPAVTEHYINLLVISLTSPYRQESGSFLPSWAPGPSTLGQRRGLDPASLLSPRSSHTCPERGPGGQVQRKPSSFARGVGRLEAPSGGLRTSRSVVQSAALGRRSRHQGTPGGQDCRRCFRGHRNTHPERHSVCPGGTGRRGRGTHRWKPEECSRPPA